jgi:hypothetical protein
MGNGGYHLGKTSRRIVAEVAEIVLPEEGRTEEIMLRVIRYVDDFVPHLPKMMRTFFPLGLLLIQWGTLLTLSALKPFTLLGSKARDKYLKQWGESPFPLFRALWQGVRGLILSGYYSMPAVYRKIGYTPDEHVARCKAKRAELIEADGGADHHTRSMIFEDI